VLANIQRFFQEMLAEGEGGAGLEAPSLELAAAALLCEVMLSFSTIVATRQ